MQRASIAQAEAQRLAAQAHELQTRLEQVRQNDLLRGGLAGTRQRLEQATADHETAIATRRATDATIDAQRRELDVLTGRQAELKADLLAAQAALRTAQLRQGYTRIVAPFDGIVGQRQVQEGDYVNIGSNLIAVVPLPNVYVIANYKETQLTNVAPGQSVDVTVDTYPGLVLRGRVARLSPASGATFSLLPPDNATGNFTKVVQRIPVRIEVRPRPTGARTVAARHVGRDPHRRRLTPARRPSCGGCPVAASWSQAPSIPRGHALSSAAARRWVRFCSARSSWASMRG